MLVVGVGCGGFAQRFLLGVFCLGRAAMGLVEDTTRRSGTPGGVDLGKLWELMESWMYFSLENFDGWFTRKSHGLGRRTSLNNPIPLFHDLTKLQ